MIHRYMFSVRIFLAWSYRRFLFAIMKESDINIDYCSMKTFSFYDCKDILCPYLLAFIASLLPLNQIIF